MRLSIFFFNKIKEYNRSNNKMSDSHHNHDSHDNKSHPAAPNAFMDRFMSVLNIFDGPASFFRGIVNKTRSDYPYYHRKYPRVPTVDQCGFGDNVCLHEANEQFLRDRKVDKYITQILAERVKQCYINEGHFDGFEKCRQLDDDYERALTNYYIKYGDLAAHATVIDAYMKQKHRLIWQRRNPEKDIVGLESKQKEIRDEVAKYHRRAAADARV